MKAISERNAAMGMRISEIREDRNLTQAELAHAIGVSKYRQFHYEHGQTRIAVEYLERLAEVLHCKMKELRAPAGSPFRKHRSRRRRPNGG